MLFGRGGECGAVYSEVWKVDEREREVLVSRMEEIVDGFEGRHDEEVMLVLSEVCRDGRAIEKNVGEKILCSRLIKIKLTDVPGSSSDFS